MATGLETNLFAIGNAGELNCDFRLFTIRGLDPDSDEYEKNAQRLVDSISRTNHVPAVIHYMNGMAHLALPAAYPAPPTDISLVRAHVRLDPVQGTFPLRFDQPEPGTEALCVRFLQFALQSPLWRSRDLWQPSAGSPFFYKQARTSNETIDLYEGFAIRVVAIENGPLAICVDITSKYVSREFLPSEMTRDDFRKLRGSRCVYHFGHRWYEIRLQGYHDLNASEVLIEDRSLRDYILSKTPQPHPPELLSLPQDSAVLTYRNGSGRESSVPSALCRLTYDTESMEVRGLHRGSIRPPQERRTEIFQAARRHLKDLPFNGVRLTLDKRPVTIQRSIFPAPDVEFGRSQILSVRGTPGARHTTLQQLGQDRLSLLQDSDAGFWSEGRLDRQYAVLPKSVTRTFGSAFLEDLGRALVRLYPDAYPYSPTIIEYDDDVPKTPARLGKQILRAVDEQIFLSGYALVMIAETPKKSRSEDQLAHLVMQELRKRDLHSTVIHTTVPTNSYELVDSQEGPTWAITNRRQVRSRFNGYLRNVALNKILLLNRRWPFVLSTPLKADVVVGIDVKGRTAGFTFIQQGGRRVRFESDTSKQRERLRSDQVEAMLVRVLREELKNLQSPVNGIVLHRQGKAFLSEIKGIKRALSTLQKDGLLNDQLRWAIVEVAKTSLARLRLFDVTSRNGRPWVDNAEIGSYGILSATEGFLCTTGRSFRRSGTVRPIFVRLVEGNFSVTEAMEDVYSLANLTWTRPEDCSRDPLSVRMNDIRLREVAGEYDPDGMRYSTDGYDDEAEVGGEESLEQEVLA